MQIRFCSCRKYKLCILIRNGIGICPFGNLRKHIAKSYTFIIRTHRNTHLCPAAVLQCKYLLIVVITNHILLTNYRLPGRVFTGFCRLSNQCQSRIQIPKRGTEPHFCILNQFLSAAYYLIMWNTLIQPEFHSQVSSWCLYGINILISSQSHPSTVQSHHNACNPRTPFNPFFHFHFPSFSFVLSSFEIR